MIFHDNNVIETTVEVWRAIREAHQKHNMVVFSSYSSLERMETCWGFKGADNPTICAKTDNEIDENDKIISSKHFYMLVIPKKEDD
jgi:hypothetical protein